MNDAWTICDARISQLETRRTLVFAPAGVKNWGASLIYCNISRKWCFNGLCGNWTYGHPAGPLGSGATSLLEKQRRVVSQSSMDAV